MHSIPGEKHMKKTILSAAVGLMLAATSAFAADRLAHKGEQVCWLETSAAKMDAAMGGSGIRDSKVWDSTISSVLIRHANGDVLIDTGFGPDAEAQMSELPDASRAFGLQVLSGAKDRKSILDTLVTVNEKPDSVARILVTHAHYDHLGGAVQLTAPIYVTSVEFTWMADQAAHPTITPPSLVAAVRPRIKTLAYGSGPYLGFESSDDIYGDGSIVAVPLPGHTPGSQGVFVKLGKRRVFLIGDATDMLEAAVRGLPKSSLIRAATDSDPELADTQATRIAEFHRLHPDIAIVPAHDRAAYSAVFGSAFNCLSSFKPAS
jgi:N-acyl homoserine lactone hydrolase